jgi:hypothetical protein
MVWQERPAVAWRVPLAAAWLVSTPIIASSFLNLSLNRWPLVEVAMLAGLVLEAWWPGGRRQPSLTGQADLGEPATA